MAHTLSNTFKNATLDALVSGTALPNKFENLFLGIYTAAYAAPLYRAKMSASWWAAATNGIGKWTPLTIAADASGTAAVFRIYDTAGNSYINGTVGTSTQDLVVSTTSLTAGTDFTISAFDFSFPAAYTSGSNNAQYNVALRNALVDMWTKSGSPPSLQSFSLNVYSGTQPATADTALAATNELLCSDTFSSIPTWAAASAGSKGSGIYTVEAAKVVSTGTPTFARLTSGSFVLDLTVGNSASYDLNISASTAAGTAAGGAAQNFLM